MTVIVGRPINGISLNGLEYLLDEEGNTMKFNSEQEATEFLGEELDESLVFIEEGGGIINGR